MLTALIVFTTVVAGFLYYVKKILDARTSPGILPPGPPGWPIVGNVNLMGPKRHQRIQNIGDQHGGIFTTTIGIRKSVWLTKYRLIREAVIDHAWEFAGRSPELHMLTTLQKGIVASGVNEEEKEVRRWILVTLRNFGFGKSSMQDAILQEASNLVLEFKKKLGTPFNPRNDLANAAGNVISELLLGEKFEQGDEGFRKVSESVTEGIKVVLKAQAEDAFPLLKLFSNSKRALTEHFGVGIRYLQKVIDEHIPSHVQDEPRDFIDTWLDQEAKSKDLDSRATFLRAKLPGILLDVFTGGFETTTTSFQWIFAMLLTYPEVQARIHAELDEVVGKGTAVTLEHRDALAYIEAVILETLRMYPLLPFSVPHMCTKDASLGGYTLSKGTRIILHIFSVHYDPELWDQPTEFRPERFIKNGKLVTPEYFLAFSAGRRSCIGEQLARKELFLFFANIMQSLSIVLPVGAKKPSLEMKDGVVMYPLPFDIEVRLR